MESLKNLTNWQQKFDIDTLYSMEISGKNYEKTYEICRKILNKILLSRRNKIARSVQAYNEMLLEFAYRDLDMILERYVPTSVRRRIRFLIRSYLS